MIRSLMTRIAGEKKRLADKGKIYRDTGQEKISREKETEVQPGNKK